MCLVVLAAAGCSVQQEYAEAEEAAMKVWEPKLRAYLVADEKTPQQEKEEFDLLLRAMHLRIDKGLGR